MKLSKVIQRIQSLYSKGVESDDTRLSSRHIYNKILTSLDFILFKNKLNGIRGIDEILYKTLDCQNLIKANSVECPCVNPIDCDILRTKCKIPKIKSIDNKLLIQSISSIDGFVSFSETTFENAKYLKSNKFTGKLPYYFIKNDYIYIINGKKIKSIRIKAIFSDFVEVFLYNCNNNNRSCLSALDVEFPAPNKIIEEVIQNSVNELVYNFMKMQEDLTNDSKDSSLKYSK